MSKNLVIEQRLPYKGYSSDTINVFLKEIERIIKERKKWTVIINPNAYWNDDDRCIPTLVIKEKQKVIAYIKPDNKNVIFLLNDLSFNGEKNQKRIGKILKKILKELKERVGKLHLYIVYKEGNIMN